MKKTLQKMMMAGLGSVMILGCSAEDVEEQQLSALNAVGSTTNEEVVEITPADLVGRWELDSMTSVSVPVNLDGDQDESTNILSETTCFTGMYFDFKSDGKVETEQARLYFNETGNFTCDNKVYVADYGVSSDTLSVTFSVKGTFYTEKRKIAIKNDGVNDYLEISLTGAETDAAVYVNDGREKTVAKDIEQIDFVYIRK